MSWKHFTSLILGCTGTIAASGLGATAAAQSVGASSDVTGLQLGMTRAQASAVLATLGKVSHTISITLGTKYFSDHYDVGAKVRPADPNLRDDYRVTFYPGTDRVVAVSRRKSYDGPNHPLLTTLVNALIGKYGQPDGVNGGDYYWFSNKYLTRNGNFQTGCTLAMDNYAGPMPDVYAGEDNDDPSGSAVSYLVNYYEKNANLADCGQILKYRITNSNDGQHIDSLEATLVDFPAAQAAVTVFADAFWKRAKAAEDAKLNSDAAIKPNI